MFRGDFRDKSFENRIKINFKSRLLAWASNRVLQRVLLELVLGQASGLLSGLEMVTQALAG